jgi:hypothetical protein
MPMTTIVPRTMSIIGVVEIPESTDARDERGREGIETTELLEKPWSEATVRWNNDC